MGLCTSSFSLAVNSYFKRKRSKAFGIGVTITGIGPIILPQLISLLLGVYGSQGCVLIISGIAMNIIPAALLLQPVKWHQKKSEEIDSFLERNEMVISL
jgi:MFS family permease